MGDYMSGPVCIDELVTVLAEYDPRQRWNGWLACPWIDAWSAVTVLDAINGDLEGENAIYGYDYTFDDAGTLVLVDRQAKVEMPDYTSEPLAPNEDGLYSLGAYGWVWSEDADACPHCGSPSCDPDGACL